METDAEENKEEELVSHDFQKIPDPGRNSQNQTIKTKFIMAASKLAETWSQTENCIDDGGFLPRLARSWKIDYGEMVETRAVFRFAQFRKRRDVGHVTSKLKVAFSVC